VIVQDLDLIGKGSYSVTSQYQKYWVDIDVSVPTHFLEGGVGRPLCDYICPTVHGVVLCDTAEGMSVKIGSVINGEKTYIVGAPRSTEVGQVLLLQPQGDFLVVKLTLTGEQFGSGFGYDIALGDFNNDRPVAIRNIYLCASSDVFYE